MALPKPLKAFLEAEELKCELFDRGALGDTGRNLIQFALAGVDNVKYVKKNYAEIERRMLDERFPLFYRARLAMLVTMFASNLKGSALFPFLIRHLLPSQSLDC